jgi:hypothetical protein
MLDVEDESANVDHARAAESRFRTHSSRLGWDRLENRRLYSSMMRSDTNS